MTMASEETVLDNKNPDEPPIIVVDAELVSSPQTQVREAIQPYLPPPVVKAIHNVDPLLEPYIGPEASINIFGTLLLGLLLYQILQQAVNFSGSKAVVADEDTQALTKQLTQKAFEESILIWGASGAGKTRLFYYLCFGTASIKSIASLRTNVGFHKFSSKTIRFLDVPAHQSLDEAVRSGKRILFLVDATQPVARAADLLYQILHGRNQSRPLFILLCCNKSDVAGSKNWKRIKIQLRTEMERLLKVQLSATGEETGASMEEFLSTGGKWVWDENKPNNVSFAFLSTSLETKAGLDALRSFCEVGTVPDQSIRGAGRS